MRVRGGSCTLALAIALAASPVAVVAQEVPATPVVAADSSARPISAAPGEASVAKPRRRHAKGDPLEGFNRVMYAIHRLFDRILFRPAAIVYKTVVPKVLRIGFRNVLSNIDEPLVFANDVLQLKPKRAIKTLGRFLVNSTIGIGGLLDVAKTEEFKLPHHDNSFGTTLARYGVGPGPYIFLPFIGPSTLRDLSAQTAQDAVLPLAIGGPFDDTDYQVVRTVIGGLDLRAESDADLKALLGGAVDPYATLRSAYLQDRAGAIARVRHGKASQASPLDDPLADPAAPTDGTATLAPSPAAPAPDDLYADPAPPTEAPPAEAAPAAPVP